MLRLLPILALVALALGLYLRSGADPGTDPGTDPSTEAGLELGSAEVDDDVAPEVRPKPILAAIEGPDEERGAAGPGSSSSAPPVAQPGEPVVELSDVGDDAQRPRAIVAEGLHRLAPYRFNDLARSVRIAGAGSSPSSRYGQAT